MRKINVLFAISLLISGCSTQSGSLQSLFAAYDGDEGKKEVAAERPVVESGKSEIIEVSQPPIEEKTVTPDEAAYVEQVSYDRYRHNVAIKAHDSDSVTYEYRNIRIDELAPLAIRYCDEQGGKKALLRSIVLHQNHNRVAIFDCKNLAMEQ